jgi:hypothetical protein
MTGIHLAAMIGIAIPSGMKLMRESKRKENKHNEDK